VFLIFNETMTLDQYLLENYGTKSNIELVKDIESELGVQTTTDAIRNRWHRLSKGETMPRKQPSAKVEDNLERDRKLDKLTQSERVTKKKYDQSREALERAERERDAVKVIQDFSKFAIKPKGSTGKSESVAIVLASDWHCEENVAKAAVSGLNEYNLTVARARAVEFFQGTLRLVQIFQKDTRIDTLVIALLGDFISGNIHEDIAENNNLGATHALIFAEELITSGIQFLLDNSTLDLVIPCHSGNHGRTTKDQRMATENENSFEYYMYHVMARHFEGNKRVKFLISESYVSYLPVYDYTIRFHHGHGMKYGGGVGGLFIPTYKAIARWNDGRRANIDCFGHFHQFRDGGSFVANGSMIGYNAYAISRGLSYERAQQVMFVIEKNRGRTFTVPITFKV
jgi:hypothetical protein